MLILKRITELLLEFILIDHGWGNKKEEEQSFEKEGQAIRTHQGGVIMIYQRIEGEYSV